MKGEDETFRIFFRLLILTELMSFFVLRGELKDFLIPLLKHKTDNNDC